MNFLNVVAYIYLILELVYLSVIVIASKIPYLRNTRSRLANSITASVVGTWLRLLTVIVIIVLMIHFSMSLWKVASLQPFTNSITGKTYDAYRAGRFLEERNTYLSGFVLVLYFVISTASFEPVVVEGSELVVEELERQEEVGLAQTPMVETRVQGESVKKWAV